MTRGRLPTVNGRRVIQALRQAGFEIDRFVGSHYILPGTLRAIIRKAGLTVEEFAEFL
jgi:predicted RNA binding protein YcfA (HicA-like mRNA interferase family)